MRPDADRIAALTAEIARLEGSMESEAHLIEALRRDLAVLQADPDGTSDQPPRPAAQDTPARQYPDDDPGGDLFDDVPV
jgi:hypothetical protein